MINGDLNPETKIEEEAITENKNDTSFKSIPNDSDEDEDCKESESDEEAKTKPKFSRERSQSD